MMLQSRGSDKAGGYIAQLYEARNAGQWQTVPELARKVEKHAPTRRGTSERALGILHG